MAGPNPGEAIKAFCPNLDLVACAEANKDVCDMGGGEDDHEEGHEGHDHEEGSETEGGDRRLEGHGGDEDGDDDDDGLASVKCLCSNDKIIPFAETVMSGAAGVCKDAPMKQAEGGRRLEGHGGKELDVCKLSTDGPKACADMLAAGYTALMASAECKKMQDGMKMSDTEKKCVDDMLAAAPAAAPGSAPGSAPAPGPAEGSADETILRAGGGLSAFIVLLLLAAVQQLNFF